MNLNKFFCDLLQPIILGIILIRFEKGFSCFYLNFAFATAIDNQRLLCNGRTIAMDFPHFPVAFPGLLMKTSSGESVKSRYKFIWMHFQFSKFNEFFYHQNAIILQIFCFNSNRNIEFANMRFSSKMLSFLFMFSIKTRFSNSNEVKFCIQMSLPWIQNFLQFKMKRKTNFLMVF